MGHSVEAHLSLDLAEYDRHIRRLVPDYDALIDEMLAAVQSHGGEKTLEILDVGAGNGALAERLLSALPNARVMLLDLDAAMVEKAKQRLRCFEGRAAFKHGSFLDPLPACDVAVASLSLHHVRDEAMKLALYKNIHRAIRSGGALVNGDAAIEPVGKLHDSTMTGWAQHLQHGGDSEDEAHARFQSWATEDRYFSVHQERDALRAAGFSQVDVVWRKGPMSVLVGLR